MADRKERVILDLDNNPYRRGLAEATVATQLFVKNLESADSRMGNLVQTALAIAPALVPLSATGVPALMGIATEATAAAAGIAVLVTAFHGVGDALEAVNKYQLDPTDANLKKMREEMGKLPAEGRHFVRFLDQEILPALDLLQDKAAAGVLPGFEDGIESLMRRLPELSVMVEDLSQRAGDLAADTGAKLASDDLDEFFTFLNTEVGPTFETTSRTVGNLLEGIATSLIGLNPLANDFEQGLLGWSEGFSNIDPSDFYGFVNYVRDVGPQALDTLGAIGSGIVSIAEAAAPVGAVTLPVIEALANVIQVIADSPAGPALIGTAAGLAAVSRTMALFQAANGSALLATIKGVRAEGPGAATAAGGVAASYARMEKGLSALKVGAPILGGLALAYTDLDDKAGLSNTAMLATAGLMAGPWGAAIGGAIGLLLDYKAAGAQAEAQNDAFKASIEGMTIDELNDGLEQTINLLAAMSEDNILRDVVSDRKKAIEDQIDATQDLANEQQAQERAAAMAYATEIGLNLRASRSVRMTTEQIKAQADALQEVMAQADATSSSFLGYGDSISDAKVSLGEWLRQQEKAVDALANFNTNSLRAARKGLDEGLIVSLRDAGKEGALRMAQLANGTEAGVNRANKAYRGMQAEIERTRDITRKLVGMSPVKVDVDAETGAAMTNLKSLENYLRSIKDEDVFVNVRHRQYGQSGGFGPVDGNAWGDFKDRHSPEIADGGSIRMWAEPETQGESYIPHANDARRPRAKRILEHTADIFGGEVLWFADGGTTGDQGRKKKRKPPTLEYNSTPERGPRPSDIADMLRAAEEQENAAARQADAARTAARAADDQLDAAEKGAQAAEDHLKAAEQQRDSFRDAVSGRFTSSLTGGGLAGLTQNLARDTNAGASMDATLRALVAAGLDPTSGLYQEIANSEDLQTANELLAAGPAYIDSIEQQYATREATNTARGQESAQQSFGPLVAQQQAAYDVAVQQLAVAQYQADRAEFRATELANRLQQMQDQVGTLAGQLADALNSTVRGGRR